MLEFLRQALGSPQLVTENDSLKIKLFVQRPYLAWSSNGRQLTPQLKIDAYRAAETRIRKGDRGDNDFVELADDFRAELEHTTPEANATTYMLVFSDFFYDPRGGNQAIWDKQRDAFGKRLTELSSLFDRKKAKLIYWYQRNNAPNGTDLGELLAGRDYLHQVENSASIPTLVESISREFRAPLGVSKAQFRYDRSGLKLSLTINNPNCSPVKLNKVSIDQIGTEKPLATATDAELSKIFEPGSQDIVNVSLKGYPELHSLRTQYLDNAYNVRVTMISDAGRSASTLRLALTEDAFLEAVSISGKTEAVIVKHILPRSERIFIQLYLDGNILEEKDLTVTARLPGMDLIATDPKQGKYKIKPDNLGDSRVLIFSFPNIDQAQQWENTGQKTVSIHTSTSDKEAQGDVSIKKIKDYRLIEWAILILIFAAGVLIRGHYSRS